MSDLPWRREPFGFLTQAVWGIEGAFKKGRAADQAESETRIRIFFLLALFATGFLSLAVGATRCALFAEPGKVNSYVAPVGAARADLVDRNGQLLAIDLTHYGVYVDPREIWDTAETQRVLGETLAAQGLQLQRL
jgi:cell division protein FtsI (penicillin-binding protein 3)